jgi:hypothetical protein
VLIPRTVTTGDRGDRATGCQGGAVVEIQATGTISSLSGSVIGGVGGTSSALAPSKGKEKQAQVVTDDDEVSSDEDLLLERRLRLLHSVTSVAGGPPPSGRHVSKEVITLWLDPSIMAMSVATNGGSSSNVSVTVDSTAAAKTMGDVVVVRNPTEDTAAMKKAADAAVPVVEMAMRAGVYPVAPDQTFTPAVGAKRVAMPSGSTPPAKHPYKGV